MRVCLLTLLIFGFHLTIEHWGLMTFERMLIWMVGVGGFLLVTACLVGSDWSTHLGASVGLYAAATSLLIHNQIEMTFFHQGAVSVAWLLMAVGGAHTRQVRTERRIRKIDFAVPLILLVGAGGFLMPTTLNLRRHQTHLASAATALRKNEMASAITSLDRAIGTLPTDRLAYRWQADLRMQWGEQRWKQGDKEGAHALLEQGLALLNQAKEAGLHHVTLLRRRIFLHNLRARLFNDPKDAILATNLTRQVLRQNPSSIQDHRFAADMHWSLGQFDQACELYQRCLQLSNQAYLDPAKQLTESDRQEIEKRLAIHRPAQ